MLANLIHGRVAKPLQGLRDQQRARQQRAKQRRTNTSSEPRVYICTDSVEPSGLGEHMLALARGLRASNCHPLLACPPSAGGLLLLDRAKRQGIATERIDPKDEMGLTVRLCESTPDIVHVHAGIGWEGHAIVRTARRAGVPKIVRTEHLSYLLTDPRQQCEYRDSVALVDRLICVSDAARDSHLAAGIAPPKLVTVRNGISPHLIGAQARSRVRTALGLTQQMPVLLTVARMTPQKGHACLIEAARAVLDRRPDVVFVLAGTGPLEDEMRGRVLAANFNRAIRFLGQRRDVPDLLAAADIFVLPSQFEGLPLVVLEAMAAGLPVVATRIGGTEEAVLDGATGLLVPPADPAALATALLVLIQDPKRRRTLGKGGLARFRAEFQAARMTAEILDLYRSLAPAGSHRDRTK